METSRRSFLEADVVIVGSGAGGGVTAEILALANPQLSIYAIAARLASGLARSLGGNPAPPVEA